LSSTHATILMSNSDLPASRKTAGLAGHTSEEWFCPFCTHRFSSLISSECFDHYKFKAREPWRFIKYSFLAHFTSQAMRDEIAVQHGKCWSAFDALPGWIPSLSSPLEWMHMVYLCLVKHLLKGILLNGGMFNSNYNDVDPPLQRFEEILNAAWWPGSVSRPPKKAGAGSLKADQLRNMLTILPIALFHAWNIEAHLDASHPTPTAADYIAAQNMERSHNYKDHYESILSFCAALQILGNRSITSYEAARGLDMLSKVFRKWALSEITIRNTLMNLHMTPYFHLVIQAIDPITRFGPVYGWHVYPYERHNGKLGRFNHNGHAGGELEATLMRSWWRGQLVTTLVA
ncbi:hypothetical protein JB92DRAFT_2766223, partial [Gautieria morchelliformis]